MYTIFCIIPGGDPAFSVQLKEMNTVDNLKEVIKVRQHPNLDKYPSSALTLYKIDVDISKKANYVKEVDVIYQGLSSLEELEVGDKLKEVFSAPGPSAPGPSTRRMPSGPPPGRIHILVHLPIGEPHSGASS